jgi:N-acetylneuraminate synthase
MISFFRERYGCAIGLSDHSGTIYPGLAATALGLQFLEVHVTFSREMFGPDVEASITTSDLGKLVEGIRFTEKMMANPVDKEAMAQDAADLRAMFTKSVVVRRDLPAGTVLGEADLTLKKPGTGMVAARLPEVIGRRLKRAVAKDTLISEDDLE